MQANYVRDISRGIISRQKSGRVGSRSRSGRPPRLFKKSRSRSGRPPRLSKFPRQFEESRGQSRLSPTFNQKSGRVGISSTFPDFRLKSRGESRFDLDLSRLLSRLFEEIGQKSRGESRFGLDLSRLLSRLIEEVWAPRSRCKIEIGMKKKSRSRFSVEIGEASPIDLAHSCYALSLTISRPRIRPQMSNLHALLLPCRL